MFIKSKIVEDAVTTHDLTKIDVQKKENQIVCFENVENCIENVSLFLVWSSIVTLFLCTS